MASGSAKPMIGHGQKRLSKRQSEEFRDQLRHNNCKDSWCLKSVGVDTAECV